MTRDVLKDAIERVCDRVCVGQRDRSVAIEGVNVAVDAVYDRLEAAEGLASGGVLGMDATGAAGIVALRSGADLMRKIIRAADLLRALTGKAHGSRAYYAALLAYDEIREDMGDT